MILSNDKNRHKSFRVTSKMCFVADVNTAGAVAFLTVLVIAIPIVFLLTKPKHAEDEVRSRKKNNNSFASTLFMQLVHFGGFYFL